MCDDEEVANGENGEVYSVISFLIEGVLTAALGIFGILGNIVSIKVRRCNFSTGCPICSCNWVGVILIVIFHHIAQPPGRSC